MRFEPARLALTLGTVAERLRLGLTDEATAAFLLDSLVRALKVERPLLWLTLDTYLVAALFASLPFVTVVLDFFTDLSAGSATLATGTSFLVLDTFNGLLEVDLALSAFLSLFAYPLAALDSVVALGLVLTTGAGLELLSGETDVLDFASGAAFFDFLGGETDFFGSPTFTVVEDLVIFLSATLATCFLGGDTLFLGGDTLFLLAIFAGFLAETGLG